MFDWIFANKEWLLSGALVSVPIAIAGFYFKKNPSPKQKQIARDNSINYQAGRDIRNSEQP